MRTTTLTAILAATAVLTFTAGLATGQTQAQAPQQANPDYGKSVQDTSCYKLHLQSLRDAVDANQADRQEWNLRAADAYRQLAEAGASC